MNTFLVRWIAIYAFENVDDCFIGFYKLDFWFRGPKRIASFQRLIKVKVKHIFARLGSTR